MWSSIAGMWPETLAPVVSVRYLPTMPLEFARPFGNCDDLEFSNKRADSIALAASTTTLARTCSSAPELLSMYETPFASPSDPTVISRAIALVISASLPVSSAGAINTSGLEKFDLVWQPRLHWPQ